MTQRIALGGLDLTLNTVRFNPDAQYAKSRDVQQLLSGDNHGGAPGDNSDSLTPIYWGIPRQFPKTRQCGFLSQSLPVGQNPSRPGKQSFALRSEASKVLVALHDGHP